MGEAEDSGEDEKATENKGDRASPNPVEVRDVGGEPAIRVDERASEVEQAEGGEFAFGRFGWAGAFKHASEGKEFEEKLKILGRIIVGLGGDFEGELIEKIEDPFVV